MKLAAFAFLALATAAQAQQQCGPHADVTAFLGEKYGETRQSLGLANGHIMEVYANSETGTWTILLTDFAGTTCATASGQAFENVSEALAPAGIDS